MGIQRFNIELDNAAKVFLNGGVISGKIYLDLDAPKSIKGLKLTIRGEGQIAWQQTRFALEVKDIYPAEFVKEIYVDDDNLILGSDGPTVIPAGQHVFPFTYKLPETIPASYEDEYGKIEYQIKATIQRVWYLWNHKESESFMVTVPLDLNSIPKAAEPAKATVSKTFVGCADPVDMTVSLPVRGYVSGQTIPVTVDLTNGAQLTIKGVHFTLIKSKNYHAKAKSRREEEVMAEHVTPVKSDGNIQTRIQHFLLIPPMQPSYLKHSRLIDLDYLVRAEVRVGGLHKNFELDVPIVIGTTALFASTVAMSRGAPNKHKNYEAAYG